jgi:single-strand DNA-binding protein
MNSVSLVGRIATKPEQRGNGPVRFRVRIDEYNPKTKQTYQTYIGCSAWGTTGTMVQLYGEMDREIAINGKLRVGSYTDKMGNKRESTEVSVLTCELLGKGPSGVPDDGSDPADDNNW